MGEIKTNQTFEQVCELRFWQDKDLNSYREAGWYAALDSVILPEGRFEVGDGCDIRVTKDHRIPGFIAAVPEHGLNKLGDYYASPGIVRPLPQTVELTVEEKLDACVMYLTGTLSQHQGWAAVSRALANGKTIDELCREYGVATVREVS